MRIDIVKDFSDTPGGRTQSEGKYSGESFRESLLLPGYIAAKEKNEKLIINFDGAFGYPPSFLDESFGGLVKKLHQKDILNNIIIESNDDLTVEKRIYKYVKEAEEELSGRKKIHEKKVQ